MTELPTSALLRQTQAALAASQADLTRALAELATTRDELARAVELAAHARAGRDQLERRLDAAQVELHKVRMALGDQAAGDTRTSWQVARADYGLTCGECGAPIVRGQAVEPQPGTTHGTWIHVACPTRS